MHSPAPTSSPEISPPPAYEAAMADVERRACAGQLTLAQAKQEIFALRKLFGLEPATVMHWASLARG